MATRLVPTNVKRWKRLKRGQYNEHTVNVGGEPAVLQVYWRNENDDHDKVTPGRGKWEDVPLEDAL